MYRSTIKKNWAFLSTLYYNSCDLGVTGGHVDEKFQQGDKNVKLFTILCNLNIM